MRHFKAVLWRQTDRRSVRHMERTLMGSQCALQTTLTSVWAAQSNQGLSFLIQTINPE